MLIPCVCLLISCDENLLVSSILTTNLLKEVNLILNWKENGIKRFVGNESGIFLTIPYVVSKINSFSGKSFLAQLSLNIYFN